jgi:Flp pilus assembly pilin Flp
MQRNSQNLDHSQRGATMVETAVCVALVALIAIASVHAVGTALVKKFDTTSITLMGHPGTNGPGGGGDGGAPFGL